MKVFEIIFSRIPVETIPLYLLVFVSLAWSGKLEFKNLKFWNKKKISHENCPLRNDFIYRINESHRAGVELGMQPFLTLREQMGYADGIKSEIYTILEKHYLTLRKETAGGNPDGISDDSESSSYYGNIRKALDLAYDKLRGWYAENHLADMNDLEYLQKVEKRTPAMIEIIFDTIDSGYPNNPSFSKERLYEWNAQVLTKIENRLNDAQMQARAIARKNEDKIRQIKASITLIDEQREAG